MTFDEAFDAASQLIAQRGQLLNGHLLRLVEGDKELFREVRERLIQAGLAEDRSGVGLARVEWATSGVGQEGTRVASHAAGDSVSAATSTPAAVNDRSLGYNTASTHADWWLMKSGVVRGPLSFAELCEMHRRSEIERADVVRCGTNGLWQQPDDVAELAAIRCDANAQSGPLEFARRTQGQPLSKSASVLRETSTFTGTGLGNQQARAATHQSVATVSDPDRAARDVDQGGSRKEEFRPPEKIWSTGNQGRPGVVSHGWKLVADLVGGSSRLIVILVVVSMVGATLYWWRLPPSNESIYREFTSCRAAMQRLRDKRVGRSEWAPVVERYRPSVESIVARLKPFATEKYPAEQSLFLAGTTGLLPLLENPSDPTDLDRVYENQMAKARDSMDGKTNLTSKPLRSKP